MPRTAHTQGDYTQTWTSRGLKNNVPRKAGAVSTVCTTAVAGLEEGQCLEGTADETGSSVLLICSKDGQLPLPDAGNIV